MRSLTTAVLSAAALSALAACSSSGKTAAPGVPTTIPSPCSGIVQVLCETPSPSAAVPSAESTPIEVVSPSPSAEASLSPSAVASTSAALSPTPAASTSAASPKPTATPKASPTSASATDADTASGQVNAASTDDASLTAAHLRQVHDAHGDRETYDLVSLDYSITNSSTADADLTLTVSCHRDGDSARSGSGEITVHKVPAGARRNVTVGPMRVSFATGHAGTGVTCSVPVLTQSPTS